MDIREEIQGPALIRDLENTRFRAVGGNSETGNSADGGRVWFAESAGYPLESNDSHQGLGHHEGSYPSRLPRSARHVRVRQQFHHPLNP
jgi:hypothetical protein